MRIRLAFAAMLALTTPVLAADCTQTTHLDDRYTVCTVTNPENLQLWLRDSDGEIFGSFQSVQAALKREGKSLAFAMNGGMYHDDRRPVGHFLSDGVEEMRIVTSEGPGNFGLLPNGVFCVTGNGAKVIESRRYAANPPNCRIATQSGPMLVIDGKVHPRFMPDSTSRKRRNGVGVSENGAIHFVISEDFVRFHDFATLFRDQLSSPNALFFDGTISRLYAPALGRHDTGARMGPIIGEITSDRN